MSVDTILVCKICSMFDNAHTDKRKKLNNMSFLFYVNRFK